PPDVWGRRLYANGVMFGLVADGRIYLKADETTAPRFVAAGCRPFEYATRTGRRDVTSYWQMPEEAYDDPDALARWAAEALKVARDAEIAKRSERSAARKTRPRR